MWKRGVAILALLWMVPCMAAFRAEPAGAFALSAWVTYWDYEDALDEAKQLGGSMEELIFFAAYFDEDTELYVPQSIDDLIDEAERLFAKNPPMRYLSFVNDRILEDGSSSLKDRELLWALMGSPESMDAHVSDVIELTQLYGLEGIEIDYEAIGSDLDLWQLFLSFLSRLYGRTQEEGLKLRVLLEPSAPLSALTFPSGPSYVMMCYNLYGDHGQPGPKADDAFLRKLVRNMEALPGEKGFALATGGFRWVDGKNAHSLSKQEAEIIASENGKAAARDTASGSLHFEYLDDQGQWNTVWYADDETLSHWRSVIAECGAYATSLWKLGGNGSLGALVKHS